MPSLSQIINSSWRCFSVSMDTKKLASGQENWLSYLSSSDYRYSFKRQPLLLSLSLSLSIDVLIRVNSLFPWIQVILSLPSSHSLSLFIFLFSVSHIIFILLPSQLPRRDTYQFGLKDIKLMIDIAAAKLRDQRFALDIIAESKSLLSVPVWILFFQIGCIVVAYFLLNILNDFTCIDFTCSTNTD